MTISPCPLPAEARNFPQVPRPDREASPLLRPAGRTQEAPGSRAVRHSERGRTRQGACSPSIHIPGRTAWVRPRTSYAVQESVTEPRSQEPKRHTSVSPRPPARRTVVRCADSLFRPQAGAHTLRARCCALLDQSESPTSDWFWIGRCHWQVNGNVRLQGRAMGDEDDRACEVEVVSQVRYDGCCSPDRP